MARVAVVALMLLSALGCSRLGSDTTQPNGAQGDLGGTPFPVRDAISNVATAQGFDFAGPSTMIAMSDFASACTLRAANQGFPSGRLLYLDLAAIDASGTASPVTETGSYVVGQSPLPDSSLSAEVFYEQDDSNCIKTLNEQGTSGVVNVTGTTAGDAGPGITGNFDVTFASSGDHVTGTFAAPTCAGFDPNNGPVGGCS